MGRFHPLGCRETVPDVEEIAHGFSFQAGVQTLLTRAQAEIPAAEAVE